MKMKRFFVIFAVALLALGLVSCTRSLAPDTTATSTVPGSPVGTAAGTVDFMEEIWQLATQTAMAQQGQVGEGTPTTSQETPVAPTEQVVVETEVPTNTPVPTTVNVPSPTPGIPTSYTLQEGEFVFCIARRFNVNQYELLNVNGLTLNSRPSAGTTLKLPQTGNPFSGERSLSPHPTTYTVRAGDSIYDVACKFGDVSPDMIATANSLSAPYTLTSGQTLQIP